MRKKRGPVCELELSGDAKASLSATSDRSGLVSILHYRQRHKSDPRKHGRLAHGYARRATGTRSSASLLQLGASCVGSHGGGRHEDIHSLCGRSLGPAWRFSRALPFQARKQRREKCDSKSGVFTTAHEEACSSNADVRRPARNYLKVARVQDQPLSFAGSPKFLVWLPASTTERRRS